MVTQGLTVSRGNLLKRKRRTATTTRKTAVRASRRNPRREEKNRSRRIWSLKRRTIV